MTTRIRTIKSLGAISDRTKNKEIVSNSYIKRPSVADSMPGSNNVCSPFDSSDFEQVIFAELARPVVVRRMRAKDRLLDPSYGFEKANGSELTTKAIVHNTKFRDAKQLDSGYANIGDVELRFLKNTDVEVNDVVFDPVHNLTYELVEHTYRTVIKNAKMWRYFIGKVQ